MAYSTSNPPRLITHPNPSGPVMWSYSSTDPIATVVGTSYVSDGKAHGMKKGDIVFVVNSASTLVSRAHVIAVSTGVGTGVTLTTVFTGS